MLLLVHQHSLHLFSTLQDFPIQHSPPESDWQLKTVISYLSLVYEERVLGVFTRFSSTTTLGHSWSDFILDKAISPSFLLIRDEVGKVYSTLSRRSSFPSTARSSQYHRCLPACMTSPMDHHYQQDPMTSNYNPKDDQEMGGVDDNMSTTPTGGYNNGYQEAPRKQSYQSENYQPANGSFSPGMDSETNSRSNSGYQQQQPQPYSRPSSGLSGSGDRYGYSQTYQDQNQRPSHQDNSRAQSSVVIKVGMVGDAQIGKTSLMVKYVEGSWDEDYIQTLGMSSEISEIRKSGREKPNLLRCQFHGEDNLNTKHRNHVLNLGPGRSAGIRQYVAPSLQRCSRNLVHV